MTAATFDFKAINKRMKELNCEKWIPTRAEKKEPEKEPEPQSGFYFGFPLSVPLP